ncbi:MAG: LPS assembly lipoprotein LptE [Candidatus Neomarinimicrobiota bacterium]|jgi:hypothetical protein|nr:LPS assembly lipoprotein LptE [Candidatus Neomarinimicrobiota bacterium]MED5256315.1 LPS assembly lipoprotein LptE [Candidatus Neomarinimicrobiota bacterium]|tara:strand:+ start:435 stop:986 length:552 start_codon:yes stop_codon:yes gene_type:complete
MKNFIVIIILPFFTNCIFYSMAGSIPPHINSISIPMVENQTVEFGISEAVTDNLINQFLESNILLLDEENNADSILKGKIVRVNDAPYTYTKEESVTEYRFTITMDLEWFDVKEDKVIIKKQYSGFGAYGLSGDISSDQIDNDGDGLVDSEDEDEFGDPREYATKVAVKKIAQDILNEIMTSW